MNQSDKDLYLVRKVTVNYISTGGNELKAIINCVVFFRYERQTNTLRVYLRGVTKNAKERLFEEITDINLMSGSELKAYATEWYKENLEKLRSFA